MKSCPIILSEPDYKEMVRKKKEFGEYSMPEINDTECVVLIVKHSKSMSVTAMM